MFLGLSTFYSVILLNFTLSETWFCTLARGHINGYWFDPQRRFKTTYELLNLKALKISTLYQIRIFQCIGKMFRVEFSRNPLKFHNSTQNILTTIHLSNSHTTQSHSQQIVTVYKPTKAPDLSTTVWPLARWIDISEANKCLYSYHLDHWNQVNRWKYTEHEISITYSV